MAPLESLGDVDVTVIGAGFSGLTCAAALADSGCALRIVVLEARERVGGRTCNETVIVPDSDGGKNVRIDVGGAYVGPTQDRLLRVARSVGVETYPVYVKGKSVVALVQNDKASKFEGTIPALGPVGLIDLNKLLTSWDAMAETVPSEQPWSHPEAQRLDNTTVEEWLRANTWSEDTYRLGKLVINTVLCKEPSEVSLLYWLWYVKSGQGVMRLTEVDNGAQERKFKQGSCTICERIAERLGSQVVRLGSAVSALEDQGGQVEVTTSSGSTFKAKYVVVALAPSLYGRIQFSPPLPQLKTQLAASAPMGSIIKTNMFWSRPFWRERGLNGSIASHCGPISYSMDDCGSDSSRFSIMGFVLARHATEWCELSKEDRQRAIAEQYATMFGIPEMAKPIAYLEKNWNEEEWSGGCYVASMPPSVLTSFGPELRRPAGRVHFAGTETATKWVGYMDGAIEAGERAAREVLLRLAAEGSAKDPVLPPSHEPPDLEVIPRPNDSDSFPSLPGVGGFLAMMAVAAIAAGSYLFSIPTAAAIAAIGAGIYSVRRLSIVDRRPFN